MQALAFSALRERVALSWEDLRVVTVWQVLGVVLDTLRFSIPQMGCNVGVLAGALLPHRRRVAPYMMAVARRFMVLT